MTIQFVQSHIDQIKLEHPQKGADNSFDNLGWFTATPCGRKSEQAYQIVDATLKSLDLL